jgi:hypothetical protein
MNFLGYEIKTTTNGIIICKDNCNVSPGACTYSSVREAQKSVIILLMIDNPKYFQGPLFWRLHGRGGSYFEFGNLTQYCKDNNIEIPENVKPLSANLSISVDGEQV